MNLTGTKVLVTGGTAGIGLALTGLLIKQGATVIAVGRNEARMKAALSPFGPKAEGLRADLSQSAEVNALIERIHRDHPDLSLLVNNAGIQTEMDLFGGHYEEMSMTAHEEIAANLTAPILLSMGLLPLLARQRQASIVNISSALALSPKKAAPVYCATKAGLRNFTKALRFQCEDMAPHIQVTDVIMTLVETGMTTGRGTRKMRPEKAARAIRTAIIRRRKEASVGKTRLLPLLQRLCPKMVECILK